MARKILILSIMFFIPFLGYGEEYNDRIIAIVNDKVILQSEVQNAIDNLTQDEITKEFSTLNERDIIKKVVDKLINESLLIQAAERFGINISDIALEKNILSLAAKENLTINEFREKIIKSGIKYDVFVSKIRDKMTVEALFVSQFYARMNVTEEEVDNFIRRENIDEYGQLEFDLIELVIEDEEKIISSDVVKEIYNFSKENTFLSAKDNFKNVEINVRNIGVVKKNELPNLFVEALLDRRDGEVTDIIKSSRGYHILKIVSVSNKASTMIDEYKVRHILIKPNPMKTDKDVKNQLFEIRNTIKDVDDFSDIAKKYSEDNVSAIRGGDLNWQRTKNLVPEFADVMKKTPIGTISDPFASQFGWHILFVENKRTVDDARSIIRKNVAQAIRVNKAKREKDDWMAKLKDQAYINIKEF